MNKGVNPGGIIILYDTNPENNNLIHPGYCWDSYKIVKCLDNRPDINCTAFILT